MRRNIVTMAIATVAAIALLVPAGAAGAGERPERGGPERDRQGSCDPRGRWEVSLDAEGGRIEVDYEVTAKAGQRWKVVILHDGDTIFDGSKVTRVDDDDRPDFEVDRRVRDHAGTDRFTARARNTVTGAMCVNSIAI